MDIIPKKYGKPPSRFVRKDEGESLDEATRSSMESLLGHDLRDVRIHQTGQAGEIARRLGAEAFTIGSQVYSAEGALTSPFKQNKGLLAHELTHVIQQTGPQPLADKPGIIKKAENPGMTPSGIQKRAPWPFRLPGSDLSSEMENEASRTEMIARRSEIPGRNTTPEIDPEQIADIVYALMQAEIRIENDRIRR